MSLHQNSCVSVQLKPWVWAKCSPRFQLCRSSVLSRRRAARYAPKPEEWET